MPVTAQNVVLESPISNTRHSYFLVEVLPSTLIVRARSSESASIGWRWLSKTPFPHASCFAHEPAHSRVPRRTEPAMLPLSWFMPLTWCKIFFFSPWMLTEYSINSSILGGPDSVCCVHLNGSLDSTNCSQIGVKELFICYRFLCSKL
jgi:hypothetical protein